MLARSQNYLGPKYESGEWMSSRVYHTVWQSLGDSKSVVDTRAAYCGMSTIFVTCIQQRIKVDGFSGV